MRGTPGGLTDGLACRGAFGQMDSLSSGAASRLAGRLLFCVTKRVSTERFALHGCGACLLCAPKMGDTFADEGHREE